MKGRAATATDGAAPLGGGGAVTGPGVDGVVGEGPPEVGGGVAEVGGGVAEGEGVGVGLEGADAPPPVTLMASFWPKKQC